MSVTFNCSSSTGRFLDVFFIMVVPLQMQSQLLIFILIDIFWHSLIKDTYFLCKSGVLWQLYYLYMARGFLPVQEICGNVGWTGTLGKPSPYLDVFFYNHL